MNKSDIELIEKSFDKYWNGEESPISDKQFDELIVKLSKDEPNHPLINKLGINTVRGEKVYHEKPMLSLDKVYSYSDLEKWIKSVSRNNDEQFIVQYKFDGLAGKLSNGILSTRGDGKVGENISRRKKDIRLVVDNKYYSCSKIPLCMINDDIVGEIVVTEQYFNDNMNRIPNNTFKHPRNFVVGMVNRKDDLPDGIKLDFVAYEYSSKVFFKTKEFNDDFWNDIVCRMQIQKEYPTDGLVIKLYDKEYSDSLGFTSHHPNGSIAFKFYGERVWTKVRNIEWGMGKECLTPVAVFDSIYISGSNIDHATIHNAEMLEKLDIAIGDEIEVEKAGEIIPHITNVRKSNNSKHALIPNICPYCGSNVERIGVESVCKNINCSEKLFQKLLASVSIFEIDGMGENTLRSLFKKGIDDLYKLLTLKKENILELDGFKEKSANNLYNAIQKAKNISESKLLASLNTIGVGENIYKLVLQEFSLGELISGADFQKLSSIKGIGNIRAKEIKRSIANNKNLLSRLINGILNLMKEEKVSNNDTICFTGKMPESRTYYENIARERGFNPVSSVSKDLKILVTTEIDRKSSKMDNARKFGVKIITLDDWLNIK